MYTVAVKRDFIAQHYLIGGDWGDENQLHAHNYVVEVQVQGSELDEHGYLVDIVDLEANLDSLVAAYRDQVLNQMAAFRGLNPSIEHFSRILCLELGHRVLAPNIKVVAVKVWENNIAWASYQHNR